MVGVCVAGFVALIIAGFRFAAALFGEPVGWICALLLLSRLDYGFLAARGFIDVPFLALVVWAAALEAERPRRGGAVWVLLAAAGLLRPEAWLLSGAYALYLMLADRRLPRPSEIGWVGDRAGDLDGDGLARHGRPDVLVELHDPLGRGTRPPRADRATA